MDSQVKQSIEQYVFSTLEQERAKIIPGLVMTMRSVVINLYLVVDRLPPSIRGELADYANKVLMLLQTPEERALAEVDPQEEPHQ